jgi:hypothetical protein
MKTFVKAVTFAIPGTIAIILVAGGCYLIAAPLFFAQPVATFSVVGRQVTSLQAGLWAFVLGLVVALLSVVGSLHRSRRFRGSPDID